MEKAFKKSELTNNSINTKLARLTSIYDFLKDKGMVKYNLAKDVRCSKIDASGNTPVITNDQVTLLLSKSDQRNSKELRDTLFLFLH